MNSVKYKMVQVWYENFPKEVLANEHNFIKRIIGSTYEMTERQNKEHMSQIEKVN